MTLEVYKKSRTVDTDVWGEWVITTDAPPYINTTLVEYKINTSIDIEISDITDATTVEDGTGIFDALMQAATLHINSQIDKNYLTQGEAGEVYATTIQTAMQQSIQFILQKKKMESDLETAAKQRDVMTTQQALYARQTTAFDDNKYQKLFDSQLNYNGIVFQDADSPDVLDVALEAKVNDVFNKLIGSSEITSMPEV